MHIQHIESTYGHTENIYGAPTPEVKNPTRALR